MGGSKLTLFSLMLLVIVLSTSVYSVSNTAISEIPEAATQLRLIGQDEYTQTYFDLTTKQYTKKIHTNKINFIDETGMYPISYDVKQSHKSPDKYVIRGNYFAHLDKELTTSNEVLSLTYNKYTLKMHPQGIVEQSRNNPFSTQQTQINKASLVYKQVNEGIDVKYTFSPTKIKEEIIVQRPESITQADSESKLVSFRTLLSLQENEVPLYLYGSSNEKLEYLTNEVLTTESLLLVDESGTIQFKIPTPIVIDASGNFIESTYKVSEISEGLYTVDIEVPVNWLQKATYPVVVDPTIEISTGNDGKIRYRCAGTGTLYTFETVTTHIGSLVSSSNFIARGWAQFDLSTIPDNAQIEQVLFHLNVVDPDEEDCPNDVVSMEFRNIPNEEFDDTPSNGGSSSSAGQDYVLLGGGDLYFVENLPDGSNFYNFDLGTAGVLEAQDLLDGNPDEKLLIGFKGTSQVEQCGVVCKASVGGSPPENEPYITVNYYLSPYCNGTLNVVTSDSDLHVRLNDVHVGTTDFSEFLQHGVENVLCNSNQNIKVLCSDNITVCHNDNFYLGTDGETATIVDSNCEQLCSEEENLWITNKDVSVSGSTINITLHSSNLARTVPLTISRVNRETGLVDRTDALYPFVNEDNSTTLTTTMTLNDASAINIYLDPNSTINEPKDDNFVYRLVLQNAPDAYLSINTSYPEVDSLIRSYLEQYVNSVPENQAELIVSIGRFTPEFAYGNFQKDFYASPIGPIEWGYRGSIMVFDEPETAPYSGLVGRTVVNGNPIVLVYGNSIIGDIAAVKAFVNGRSYLFSDISDYFTPTRDPIVLDAYDIDALGVNSILYPLLTNNGGGGGGTLTPQFLFGINKVLFDNIYDVAIRTVKTRNTTSYGNSTILRLKNVNADYDSSFRDAISGSDIPVVFSGGIFSNLESWEFPDGEGLARRLANTGRDVWEIEMNGGPTTECSNCPNYNSYDQVDYYWPSLIGGVLKYTNNNAIDYVAHSNGCRVALLSLNAHSQGGIPFAGYYFNYSLGTYEPISLPPEPIDEFFGVACPALVNDYSPFTFFVRVGGLPGYEPAGDIAMEQLEGNSHVSLRQYTQALAAANWPIIIDDLIAGLVLDNADEPTISYNLMNYYNDLAVNDSSDLDLSTLYVNKLYLFATDPHDLVVPFEDSNHIVQSAINVLPEDKIQFNYSLPPINNHVALPSLQNLTETIMVILR